MRSRIRPPLVVLVLASGPRGAAGRGRDDSAGDKVPKSTPDLTVPAGADALAGNTTGTTSTTSTTATSTTGTDTTAPTTAPAAGGGTTSAAPVPAPAAPAPAQTQA